MDDAQVEEVARGICTALGLDPEERVGCGVYDDDTPAERAARKSDYVPMMMLYKPQWRLYRWKAAEAIATQAAMNAQSKEP